MQNRKCHLLKERDSAEVVRDEKSKFFIVEIIKFEIFLRYQVKNITLIPPTIK